ncbi:hypothetical protein N7540_012730 [Penicillium herquei]|nr:hypothetical protein N7540_012730 [Penicillium herquei]
MWSFGFIAGHWENARSDSHLFAPELIDQKNQPRCLGHGATGNLAAAKRIIRKILRTVHMREAKTGVEFTIA